MVLRAATAAVCSHCSRDKGCLLAYCPHLSLDPAGAEASGALTAGHHSHLIHSRAVNMLMTPFFVPRVVHPGNMAIPSSQLPPQEWGPLCPGPAPWAPLPPPPPLPGLDVGNGGFPVPTPAPPPRPSFPLPFSACSLLRSHRNVGEKVDQMCHSLRPRQSLTTSRKPGLVPNSCSDLASIWKPPSPHGSPVSHPILWLTPEATANWGYPSTA